MAILWSDNTRKNILPTGLSTPFTMKPEKLHKLLDKLCKPVDMKRWTSGLTEGEWKEETALALEIVRSGEISPLEEGSLAALLAILKADGSYSTHGDRQRMDLLLAGWGPLKTMLAFFRAYEWVAESTKGREGYYLIRRAWGDFPPYGFWLDLRKRLLEVTPEQRGELLENAAELRPQLSIYARCTLTFLFPERQDWIELDLKQAQRHGCHFDCAWGPLINLADGRKFAKLCPQHLWTMIPELSWTVLDKLGEPAAGMLLELHQERWDTNAFLLPLAIVGTPQVARVMAKCLEKKTTRKVATEFFINFPEMAFKELAGSKSSSNGAVLVDTLVHEHPEMAREASLSMEPKAAKHILRVLEGLESAPVDESSAGLPQWLTSPPWSGKSKPPKVKSMVAPDPLPWEDRLQWPEDFNTEYFDDLTEDDPYSLEEWRDDGPDLYTIDGLSRKTALRVFLETPPERWRKCTWDEGASVALWRLGVAIVPALLSIGERFPGEVREGLRHVSSPLCATFWARQLDGKKFRGVAKEWLESHPEAALVGLIPPVLESKGKEQRALLQALDAIRAEGHQALLESVLERYGPEVQERLLPRLSQDLSQCCPAKVKALPDFWQPQRWPRPTVKETGKALPLSVLNTVGEALSFEMPYPYPGLKEIRGLCDWDGFLWGLYQGWEQDGGSSKSAWAFRALGTLGGNTVARELAVKLKDWPRQNLFARAVSGLDILEQIGSDEALMHLDALSKTLKSDSLRDRAKNRLHHIARRRGLTREQLDDRLVPELGLDPDGGLTLSFGPRSFRVGFNEQLAPVVTDDKGKVRKSLPKAGKKDDEELAKAAHARWKGLKKDARKLSGLQLGRFEAAMICSRRWSRSEFVQFVLEHTLLVHLARRLVWGVFKGATLTSSFRVCEDKTLATAADEELTLSADAQVGVVHPLDLESEAWSTTFADYEILQPFPQLTRGVYVAEPKELERSELTRYSGRVIPQDYLYRLKSRGWRQGPVGDGPKISNYTRSFGEEQFADLDFSPGASPFGDWTEDQTLGVVRFYSRNEAAGPDRYIFSELVRDMEALVAPA